MSTPTSSSSFALAKVLPSSVTAWMADRPHAVDTIMLFVAFQIAYAATNPSIQWQYMAIYGLGLLLVTKVAHSPLEFFKGGIADTATDRSSYAILAGSTFISWIFAKSIQNASILGARYGILGGFAYGTWYIAFLSVGVVCYYLRTNQGYTSLQEAIFERYGSIASISYSLAVLFRLYQEIWSNSLVVASFYGDYNTASWWIAALLSTFIPFVYVSLGGLRSSLISDVIQALLAVILLVTVLGVIGKQVNELSDECEVAGRGDCNLFQWDTNVGVATNTLEGGWDLAIVGLIQGLFSYPFFDPVLTDRAFLASPKTMLRAFLTGGVISFLFIFFFGFIGIFGNLAATVDETIDPALLTGISTGIPADVARYLGTGVFTITNIIFMTTSISTLDSAFASTAKLFAELRTFFWKWKPEKLANVTDQHVALGRFAIRFIALLGTLPLLQDPSALDATTVSGTVVLGLGPPIMALLFLPREPNSYYPLAFLSSFWLGALLGLLFQLSNENPNALDWQHLTVGEGSYAKLLWFNLVGSVATLGAFVVFFGLEKYVLSKVVPLYAWHAQVLEVHEGKSVHGMGNDELSHKLDRSNEDHDKELESIDSSSEEVASGGSAGEEDNDTSTKLEADKV
jgi:Na+/proline symporter